MSKINIKETKSKQIYKRFFFCVILVITMGKHQLSKLEITNFSEKAKSVEASKGNQE